MKLKDKVAIITGGASGIGKQTAIKFANEGAKVVVADINNSEGQKTVELIKENYGEATFFEVDVSIFEQVESMIQLTVDNFGTIDIVFNNAGIGIYKPLLDHEPEDFDKVIKVNQYGIYYGVLAASRKMKELGVEGCIINTASVFGSISFLGGVIGYQSSKAAVIMMSKAAALELAPYKIRVIAVSPGAVDTPIIHGYKKFGLGKAFANQQLSKNLIKPEQVADTVAFLASDDAKAINGTEIVVDDGCLSFKSHSKFSDFSRLMSF